MKFGLNDIFLEQICEVLSSNSSILEALIFGSRAKGNYKPGSDIDIALKGKITMDEVLSLYVKFDDLDSPYTLTLRFMIKSPIRM